MKWTVLAVGRTMPPPIRELVEDYQGRLNHFVSVGLEVVAEERREKGLSPHLAMEREGARLLARIPENALTVALDASGKMLSSPDFSKLLERWRQDGHHAVIFLLGGPDGLPPAIKSSASLTLSLGLMTYPHMLARVLLFEQLYRAMTLSHGVPYHR
ncbi:MAG: 23S rRNA (pseudouridine(1915)-N(3))-methyltransferase RlmH [Magnetococcales bacterium]|nr:23S rRNA (pseudouridine(1915)-N(3))-methyltransferase RlmH [Magnetococcales bacterium]